MVVLVIIAASLTTVFKTLTTTWRKAETGVEALQSAYAILERISRELKSAVYRTSSDKLYLLGIDKDKPLAEHISSSATDEIYFIAPFKDSDKIDLYEVGYWLEDAGPDKDSLMRHSIKNTSPTVNFASSVPASTSRKAAENVTKFELLFWDTATTSWTAGTKLSWDSRSSGDNKLPIAIKIVLGLTDAKKTIQKEFEKVVFLQTS